MSLKWLLIPPAMEDQWDPYKNSETKAMIFMTMGIGWGEITEENHLAWFKRAYAWERVVGPYLGYSVLGAPNYITIDVVKRYIGLQTNVFSREPDFVFADKLRRTLEDGAVRELRLAGIDAPRVDSDSTTDVWHILITRADDETWDDEEEEVVIDAASILTARLYQDAREIDSEDSLDAVGPTLRRWAKMIDGAE